MKKTKPTRKQSEATRTEHKRTTPVQFTKQAIGELKKVVWPTASTTRQYFIVVLIFVLFIMAFIAGLDAFFGWLLLLWLS
ncbi:MAG: preprotein translocase subunit SecE [Propionibacterium sp.]|nr:preprotein translocase subunit SecE [Propionibacterium sp.]